MSDVKFEKIVDFGIIYKNEKRAIVVSLVKSIGEDGAERVYFSFHEHFVGDKGALLPRRLTPNPNSKFREKVISYTLPFDAETVEELFSVSKKMKDYMAKPSRPSNKEAF